MPVLWMSPESLFDGVSSTKSDVWSYGVLLWEIVTCGERPYTGVATEALLDLIKDGYRMSIPLQCPQNLYQIMKSCWLMKASCMTWSLFSILTLSPQPDSRPSWTELVDQLLALYHSTLPGVYLDLALPTIPTPPSSAENSDCSQEANASVYNTVTSTVSGISSSCHLYSSLDRSSKRGNTCLPIRIYYLVYSLSTYVLSSVDSR